MASAEARFTLRALPGDVRLVLAAFLLLAAAGYCAALVQVHYQSAGPGELLPGPGRVNEIYAGPAAQPRSDVERLLEADGGPFNGAGTMRPAFTTESRDWGRLTAGKTADELARLAEEREGERLAMLAWVRTGADRGAYERDEFPLPADLRAQPVTPEFLAPGTGTPRLKIRTLITQRCVECHSETGRESTARMFPFETYDQLRPHVEVRASARMALPKLAQTTHVHLLGFAVLYVATGVLFCFTGVPRAARFAIGPLPLAAQGLDIACWWLARWDGAFTWGIILGGAVAGLGFAAHVAAGLWELTRPGRLVGTGGAG